MVNLLDLVALLQDTILQEVLLLTEEVTLIRVGEDIVVDEDHVEEEEEEEEGEIETEEDHHMKNSKKLIQVNHVTIM